MEHRKRDLTFFEKKKKNIIEEELKDIEYKDDFSIGSFIIFFLKDIFMIFIFIYIIVDQTKNYESAHLSEELKYRLKFNSFDFQVEKNLNFKNITSFNEFINYFKDYIADGIYLEQTFINEFEKTYNINSLIKPKNSPPVSLPKINNLNYLKNFLTGLENNCNKTSCWNLDDYKKFSLRIKSKNNINDIPVNLTSYMENIKNETSCKDFKHKIEDNGELLSIKYRKLFERPLTFNKWFSSISILQKRRKLVKNNLIKHWSKEHSKEAFGKNNIFKYNEWHQGFQLNYNIYDFNVDQFKTQINNLIENNFIDYQTESIDFSFSFINSNYMIMCYVEINSSLKSTELFIKKYDINCFPLFSYLTFHDKTRIILEIIYFSIFILICLSEFLFLVQIINSIITVNLVKNTYKNKFKRICFYIFDYSRVYILKILMGISKYIYQRLKKSILIVSNILGFYYWSVFTSYGEIIANLNFNNKDVFTSQEYFDIQLNLRYAIEYLQKYRYATCIIFIIFIIEFFNVIFLFSKSFKIYYKIILKALKNNLYFLIFFFLLSFGFAIFIHLFFGDVVSDFSSLSQSMIIIFGTILGYKEGLTNVVEFNPIIASISIGIYFFIIIMILVNMFIIIVNAEYKYNDSIIQKNEKIKNDNKSKFDYTPFIYYNFKEQINNFFTKTIYKYFNKNKWRAIKEKEKLKNLNDRVKNSELEKIDFNKNFHSYKSSEYENLLNNNTISIEEINNNLLEKEVNFVWKFLLYLTLFLIQIIIIYILYLPLQQNYKIFENHILNSLNGFNKLNVTQTVPFNDYFMRSNYVDYLSQILNKKEDIFLDYKIKNPILRNNKWELLGDIIIKIKSNKIFNLSYNNFKPIIWFDFINYNNFIQSISEEVKPQFFSKTEMLYTKKDFKNSTIFNYCPKLEYINDTYNQQLISLINNKVDFVKPYIMKLILDKAIGPQTNKISTILLFYDKINQVYIKFSISYARNIGDIYFYEYDYNQIKNNNSLSIVLILFTLMVFKTINLLIIIIKVIQRLVYSNYEYNIWYKVEIKNSLPSLLIYHRNRKLPEIFRKLKNILQYDNIIGIIEFCLFVGFWIIFILYIFNFNELERLRNLVNTDPIKYSLIFENQFNKVNDYTFYIYLISGIENFLHCFSIISSLKNIKYFEVVIESLRIIFYKLVIVIIIMTMFILAFSFIVFYLIGYKNVFFSGFYNIESFTSILVTFSDFSKYSDNYNGFLIFIFIIPYFIIIKFTVLFVIIGIIYSSVNQAGINIKNQKKGLKVELTFKNFIKISIINLKKIYYKSINYNKQVKKLFSEINLTIRTDKFDKIYEKYNFINNQKDPTFWSNSMGKLMANEIKERTNIIKKFKKLENSHIFHLIEYKKNFFVKNYNNKDIYKIYEFISLYLYYFNQGYNKIIHLIEKESKENELLKIKVIRENIDEKQINLLKNKIIELEKKLEKSIKNIQLANDALTKIETAPNGTNLSELWRYNSLNNIN